MTTPRIKPLAIKAVVVTTVLSIAAFIGGRLWNWGEWATTTIIDTKKTVEIHAASQIATGLMTEKQGSCMKAEILKSITDEFKEADSKSTARYQTLATKYESCSVVLANASTGLAVMIEEVKNLKADVNDLKRSTNQRMK